MAGGERTVGVLALQGSFAEHLACLGRLEGVRPLPVKTPADLARAEALILPGGESTAQSRLLRRAGLWEPLKGRLAEGMPAWGTCAGAILLAGEVVGEDPHLGAMDIDVRRNAFGSQLDSFTARQAIAEVGPEERALVFIRAPWIERVGPRAQVLCRVRGQIAAARQGRLLATAFHPELTGDLDFYRYFLSL